MPTIGTGRIEPGTGNVNFERADATPPVPGLTPRAAAIFTDVRSVTGNNLGLGVGLFSGTNGANDVVLDFKSLVAGRGISFSIDANSVTINSTGTLVSDGGGGTASAFVDLTDGPGVLAPRGLLVGNASGTALVFVAPPTSPNTVLGWNGSTFLWAAPTGVNSIALAVSPPLAVTGSPVTSSGTFGLSLMPSGIEAGAYNRVTVDQFGRVVQGENVSYLTAETDSLQSVMERGALTDRDMVLAGTTPATAPNSGALVVAGGAGVGGDLFVGGNVTILGAINASLNGTASAAIALSESRLISLTGPVTGGANFDGSAAIAIATSLAPTGVNPGIYGRVQVGEDGRVLNGAELTAADIQPLVPSLTFGDLTVTGNLTVGGSASVSGNFTTVNTSNLTVEDTFLLLGGDALPEMNDGLDRGIAFRWHDDNQPKLGFFGFRRSNGRLTFQQDLPESALTSGIFDGTTGTIEADIAGTAEAAGRLADARSITLAGAVTGSVTTDFSGDVTLTAAFSEPGTPVGTFSRVLVDADGRIVSGSNPAPQNAPISLLGDVSGTGTDAITVNLASVITPGTFTRVTVDEKGRVVAGGALTNEDVVNALGFTPGGGAQPLNITGDATGTGSTGTNAVNLILAASGVIPGAYNRVVVDEKGRVIDGADLPVEPQPVFVSGDVVGSGSTGTTPISLTLTNSGVSPGTYDRVVVDSRGRVTAGSNPAPIDTIALGGDVSGTGTVGGSVLVTLADSGVSPGTYRVIVVDGKGRVTGGTSGGGDSLSDVTARGASTNASLTLGGEINVTSDTASTSSTTGALRVAGGVGIGGDVNTDAASSMNLGIGVGTPVDARLWVTGNYGANILDVSWDSSVTLNLGSANNFTVTLNGTTVLADPVNMLVGQSGVIFLAQDSAGSHTVAYGTSWRFSNGAAPTNSTAPGAVDALFYVVRDAGAVTAILIPNV